MTLRPVTTPAGTLVGWVYASDEETEQLMREVLLKETLAQMTQARKTRERLVSQQQQSELSIPRWNISDRH